MPEMKATSMEDDIKILKLEYLRNHWPDFPQILNLSSGDQIQITNVLKEDHHWKKTSKY